MTIIWKKNNKKTITGFLEDNSRLGDFKYSLEEEKWVWRQNADVFTHYAYLKDIIKKEKELNK